MANNIPSYYPTPALKYLVDKILQTSSYYDEKNDKTIRSHSEWHVGAWATTMLKKVFSGDEWIIIPERKNEYTRQRPDLTVQKEKTPYLFYEVKAHNSKDRFEDALFQTVGIIQEWVDTHTGGSIYIIIQRGCKIAFFEYHNNSDDLDYHKVPHIWKCVSLTQPLWDRDRHKKALQHIPKGVLPIFHHGTRLRKRTKKRDEAKNYTEECVFDIQEHQREINRLFHYILTHEPRDL